MKELTSLIEALRQATEGGRELDARILCAKQGYQFVEYHPMLRAEFRVDGVGHNVVAYENEIPRYTTSLDAALTLVPEGCYPTDLCWGPAKESASAYLAWPAKPYAKQVSGHGATDALALCIAALRARQGGG